MTRDILIRTRTSVRRYPLGKNVRPLTTLGRRLYRTDDAFMFASDCSDSSFIMYDIEGVQPYFYDGMISPDKTMAYTDIAKAAGSRSVSRLGMFSGINPSWIVYGLVGAIIVYAVLTGGII